MLKLEICFKSYSLGQNLTLTHYKVVDLILRMCANYQEMGRTYTVKVEKNKYGYTVTVYCLRQLGRSYTLFKLENCFKRYFHKKSTIFCARKLLN